MTSPPRFGTRKNATTGKTETYELPAPIDLERSRKELRDMIHGNTQWHVDPNAAPIPIPEVIEDDQDPDWPNIYGYYGEPI